MIKEYGRKNKLNLQKREYRDFDSVKSRSRLNMEGNSPKKTTEKAPQTRNRSEMKSKHPLEVYWEFQEKRKSKP